MEARHLPCSCPTPPPLVRRRLTVFCSVTVHCCSAVTQTHARDPSGMLGSTLLPLSLSWFRTIAAAIVATPCGPPCLPLSSARLHGNPSQTRPAPAARSPPAHSNLPMLHALGRKLPHARGTSWITCCHTLPYAAHLQYAPPSPLLTYAPSFSPNPLPYRTPAPPFRNSLHLPSPHCQLSPCCRTLLDCRTAPNDDDNVAAPPHLVHT